MKTVLCIAPYFPPVAQSGTHRSRAVARYLPEYGWQPVVVTKRAEESDTLDPSLLNALPPKMPVYRARHPKLLDAAVRLWSPLRGLLKGERGKQSSGAQKQQPAEGPAANGAGGWIDWLSWWLQFPDLDIGWLPFGLAAAKSAIARHRCQVIYSSAPPWTTHLIALLAKRLTGLPWVADFRDPWRANPFRSIPHAAIDACDARLERKVVAAADRIICNTEPVREDFARRFPDARDKLVTVTNGFDPEDYEGIEARRPVGPDVLLLTYAGIFYGPRRPHALFGAVKKLTASKDFPHKLRLQLIGQPHYGGRPLRDIGAEMGIEDSLIILGMRPHREALEAMRGSDIQVLVGFSGPGAELQVPAKLFEYFAIGRPILALAPVDSSIASLITQSGLPAEVCPPDDPDVIGRAIARLAASLRTSRSEDGLGTSAGPLPRFHRRTQVGTVAGLLSEVTRKAGSDSN